MSLIEVKKKLLMAQRREVSISDLFSATLFTGTGTTTAINTGIDLSEGGLVISTPVSTSGSRLFFDTVRGPSNAISSNSSVAQSSLSGVTSFLTNGVQVGTDNNASGSVYEYLSFKFFHNFVTVVTYTGNGSARTIPHDLGSKPGMIWIKRLSGVGNWSVYHENVGASQYAILNTTAAFATQSAWWASTEPTETEFSLGTNAAVNANSSDYVAILFSGAASGDTDFIKCGMYMGNGSTVGPVVETGWKPQFVMIKRVNGSSGNWLFWDSSRNPTNPRNSAMALNDSATPLNLEIDFIYDGTTGGFMPRSSNLNTNSNGAEYVYMAIRDPNP